MATYFVYSGAGGTNAGTSWTNAYVAFSSAITAATAAGDVIKVHKTHQESLAVDVAYTLGNNISVICVDKDASDALAVMGTGGWLGSDTTSINFSFAGSDRACRMYGLTFRNAGSGNKELRMNNGVGLDITFDNCYLWLGTTSGSAYIFSTYGFEGFTTFIDCTFRFGSIDQGLRIASRADFIRCSIAAAGSAPTNVALVTSASSFRCEANFVGCDFSLETGTVIPNTGNGSVFRFERCIFGTGATLFSAQSSNPTGASASAFFSDCLVGTNRVWGYYNAFGSAIRETGIYYTGGAAGSESWKVVTTANASFRTPFYTPWVDLYNTGTSAITPRFEIVRDGSATAYTDAQVWGEFSWKNTASSPLGSGLQNDWQGTAAAAAGTAGTDQTAGAGLGSWTGESGTAWSGKVDSGSSITPTEAGYIRGRVVVAAASITVYVDPVIRTA